MLTSENYETSEIGEIDECQNNEKSAYPSNGMNDYYVNSVCWNNGKMSSRIMRRMILRTM